MLDAFRLTEFSRDLLRGLAIDPGASRENRLSLLLSAIREMTGAAVAYLGEECAGPGSGPGWILHGWHDERLHRRRLPRLCGLSAQIVEEGGAWLEPRLRQGSGDAPALAKCLAALPADKTLVLLDQLTVNSDEKSPGRLTVMLLLGTLAEEPRQGRAGS